MHKLREQTQSRCVVTWPHLSLTPSLEKWQQRQRMLRLWTEGKNSKPKSWGSVRVRPAGELQPQTCRTPAGQSEARIGPSPANQRPGSGPLPVAFGLSAVWGREAGEYPETLIFPPSSENSTAIVSYLIRWRVTGQTVTPRALSVIK